MNYDEIHEKKQNVDEYSEILLNCTARGMGEKKNVFAKLCDLSLMESVNMYLET